MDFEWDPAKARSNFTKHGISFSDIESAFYDLHAVSMGDSGISAEERFVLLGMDALCRVVVVIYTYRGESIRIISARIATNSERKSYEKRIRF